MRALVTAASRHEATWEIAEAIAAGLNARGIEADPRRLGEIEGREGYDIIVLGSAI